MEGRRWKEGEVEGRQVPLSPENTGSRSAREKCCIISDLHVLDGLMPFLAVQPPTSAWLNYRCLGLVSMVTDWGKIVIHVLLAYSCLMEGGSVTSKLSWKSKLTKLKGIVHPKMKLCWKYTHFLGNLRFRWICFQTVLDKCSIAHHADPLQWMGAVRKRVQTADKEITIIHMTPVHQLMSCEVKSHMFVINQSIIKVCSLLDKVWVHNPQ